MQLMDIVLLSRAAASESRYVENSETYDRAALGFERLVMDGKCDPLAAEAGLDAELRAQALADDLPSKKLTGAKALSRLVEKGTVDPILAENILDQEFSRWSVLFALERAKKDSRK